MKNRLILTALITAPIIALYGALPLFIFKIIPLKEFIIPFIGLTINVLLVWLSNIIVTIKLYNASLKKRLLATYAYNFLFQFLLFIPIKIFHHQDRPKILDSYILYPILASISITIIVFVVCNSILLSTKKESAEQEVQELKLKHAEAQKQVLMQQLQPHFLFNALSVLKSLINENTELAENYAVKLSNFLRYSVDSHKAELVSLKEELQFANDYIELQKVRFENSFSFSENIPKEAMSLKIPVFALQTLIENVFKHNQLTEKNPLTIKVKYADKKLEIWNNKIPLKLVDKTNTGLQNLARRYQLSTNETIEIADLEHSFCVTIKLIEA